MTREEFIAPWLMGSITLLTTLGANNMASEGHLVKAIILGLCGIGLNLIIKWHVDEGKEWRLS